MQTWYMTYPLTSGGWQTTIMRGNNRALLWESAFHPLKTFTNINQLMGERSQPFLKKKYKWENWRYLKAFSTKGFSVWVWIRTWTFLTLPVQRFNSCKHLKGQLFIKYFSNYSKRILIKFLLQKFQGAEHSPIATNN